MPSDQVRRYYDRVDAGDIEGLVALFHPDAVYRRPGYEPFVGRAALRDFYIKDRMIVEGRHVLAHVVAQEDAVASCGEFFGRLLDGREVTVRFADVFECESGTGLFLQRTTYFYVPSV